MLLPDLESYEDQPLYITVRGITGCGGLLESTSSGFIIDPTPPSLDIIGTGSQAIERAQSVGGGASDYEFQDTAAFSSVWEVGDGESGGVGGVRVRVGSYPGGDDVSPERSVSENYIRGEAMSSNEGLPNYVTVTAENGAGLEAVAISNPIVLDTSPPTSREVSRAAWLKSLVSLTPYTWVCNTPHNLKIATPQMLCDSHEMVGCFIPLLPLSPPARV